MENCWAILKHRLHKVPTQPTSLNKLWQASTRLWEGMDQEIICSVIKDMPRCREDLKRAKGGAVMM